MTEPAPPENIVLLVHGIRTEAPWAEMVRSVLEESADITSVRTVGYGFFDVLRFLIPGPWRSMPAKRIAKEINELKAERPAASVSILAHSFGTYATARALLENPHLRIRRLCLCAGIVPRSFAWGRLAGRQIEERTLNDCGTRDIWPVLASTATVGYGPTGTFGCRTVHVHDRFHNLKHSEFFATAFAECFWRPFFATGRVIAPTDERKAARLPVPWWQSVLATFRIVYLFPAVILAALLAVYLKQPVSTVEGAAPPQVVSTATSYRISVEALADLDAGVTRGFFLGILGSPRISLEATFACDRPEVTHYDRWNDPDYEIQALFSQGNAVLLVIRQLRFVSSPYRYQGSDWALWRTPLLQISEHHMGATVNDSARYIAYIERHYFGRAGNYHTFYFSVPAWGGLENEYGPFDLLQQLMDAGSDPWTPTYQEMRGRTFANAVAIEADYVPNEELCSDGHEDSMSWYDLVNYLVAVPAQWSETTFSP